MDPRNAPWRRVAAFLAAVFAVVVAGHALRGALTSGDSVLPETPEEVLAAENLPLTVYREAPRIATDPAVPPLPQDTRNRQTYAAVNCAPVLETSVLPAAMLRLAVFAPCDRGAPVRLAFGPVSVDLRIGSDGTLVADLPVLSSRTEVALHMPNGDRHLVRAVVPQADVVFRVALAWSEATPLGLHAREVGEAPVHAGNPGLSSASDTGFLVTLGTPDGRGAQVYTHPRRAAAPRTVRISAVAGIDDRTCGTRLRAVAFQRDALGGIAETAINVPMPACGTEARSLRLKNLFRDLKLTAR